MKGIFKGWVPGRSFGFITVKDGGGDVFFHISDAASDPIPESGNQVEFDVELVPRGRAAKNVRASNEPASNDAHNSPGMVVEDEPMLNDEIEELDTSNVDLSLLEEIAGWKREAKAEDSYRYFWHVREVDQISRGEKYFVIGRKGSGKTAICEYFNRISNHDVFSEKLSFKHFPFNDLYSRNNASYTTQVRTNT